MPAPLPDYGVSFQPSLVEDAPLDIFCSENHAKKFFINSVFSAAQHAETFLKEQVSILDFDYNLSDAQLWGILADHTFYKICSKPDVYDLLNNNDYNLSSYLGIIVYTTGWASPLEEDGSTSIAPSQHDLRRRVALASCAMDKSIGSALSFADDKDNIVIDPGHAVGTLADAIFKFWFSNSHPF